MAITEFHVPSFNGYILLLLIAFIVISLLWWQPSLHMDLAEPPLLKPRIPYVGHALGFLRHQTNYLAILQKHQAPIYTLPILNKKIFVVTSPTLLQSVFRSRDLSFEPFMLEFSQRLLGVSDNIMEPTRRHTDAKGQKSFVQEIIEETHTSLTGEALIEMNLKTLNCFVLAINDIVDTLAVDGLYVWLRSAFTLATTNALFGSNNPMRSCPDLIQLYWDFENNLTPLLLNFAPSLLAPKANRGRQAIKEALRKYYKARHDLQPEVARITKQRAALCRKHGMNDHDIGEFELGLLHGALANTPPILFWLLVHIVASSSLTAAIQDELQGIIKKSTYADGKRQTSISITMFESHCPLLVSTYKETLRLTNSHIGVRRVMKDTWVSDGDARYLLKAGADVQMPAGITHLSPNIWGPSSEIFDARRFLNSDATNGKTSQEFKIQRKSFHPFGGGKHMCPGKNIALAPCLGIVAVLLLGFNVRGLNGEFLQVPEIRSVKFGEAVAKPFGKGLKVGAVITRKAALEGVVWKFVC